MSDRLKVGVAGVGSLGQWHAAIYSSLDDVELVGLFDVDAARAAQMAKKYKTRAFPSLEELARHVEAASISVPTDRHLEVASVLMQHGVHLLVEKPIACSTDDAGSMVRQAEEKDLILQVGHVERFNPVMHYLEKILVSPGFIEAIRLAPYPPSRANAGPRGTEISVVLDLMIHDLEIILHLVNSDVKEFHAIGIPVLSETEDIANVRLCFANGCVANISSSRISRDKIRKIRVFQKNTYVSLDYQNQTGMLTSKSGQKIKSERVPIEKGEPLRNELATFVACVRGHNQPLVSGRHASAALRLAVAICEHIRKGGS
ncbi:MAG: Gfo/Idh/MocA family oxidoreductase [Lentisphaerales bacterium]|jgi:predicted dehydrogenase|nr:MAG: Gfo/Idh/MocA family oxidoreductase [Lentisphaerales bacterium]